MFLRVTCHRSVTVPAQDLGPMFLRRIESYLRLAVEGKRLPEIGLVVAVIDILSPETIEAKALDSGEVSVVVNYDALVWKVFPGETLDMIVSEISVDGVFGSVGAGKIYVPNVQMTKYHPETDGGAVIFCKNDGTATIGVGDVLRARVISENATGAGHMDALATINDQYLGPR